MADVDMCFYSYEQIYKVWGYLYPFRWTHVKKATVTSRQTGVVQQVAEYQARESLLQLLVLLGL